RGWLPDVLQNGATNISEYHDLDSNSVGASFDYSSPIVEELERNCSKVSPTRAVESPSSLWHAIVTKQPTSAELLTRGVRAYQCAAFFIELDTKRNSGLFLAL
ncbi:MAG TPA: hypothetical protein VII29_12450, partial [Terriglobales bacterium]